MSIDIESEIKITTENSYINESPTTTEDANTDISSVISFPIADDIQNSLFNIGSLAAAYKLVPINFNPETGDINFDATNSIDVSHLPDGGGNGVILQVRSPTVSTSLMETCFSVPDTTKEAITDHDTHETTNANEFEDLRHIEALLADSTKTGMSENLCESKITDNIKLLKDRISLLCDVNTIPTSENDSINSPSEQKNLVDQISQQKKFIKLEKQESENAVLAAAVERQRLDMEISYPCRLCKQLFGSREDLNYHTGTHHLSDEGKFQCPTCMHTSWQLGNLKRHMTIHTKHLNIRPFKCELCGHKTTCKSYLKKHMRRHTGEKPYECSVCDYKSATWICLKRHETRHTGIKPFTCHLCGFGAVQRQALRVHMKRHEHDVQDESVSYSMLSQSS